MNNRANMMLDLETLGLKKNAVLLSIGACTFDLNAPIGSTGEKFHTSCSIKSQERLGRAFDGDVFLWWLSQSQDARGSMIAGQRVAYPLPEALRRFAYFYTAAGSPLLWCKGADNDIAWLASAYDDCCMERPFPYNSVRDMRAFTELMIPGDWETTKEQQAHDALADAVAQTKTLQRFHQRMGWLHA